MNVIVINGPMGVGKTTVGKRIADCAEGTAFIDGDWCMDLHPFVGNEEMKQLAIDNILHMIRNYRDCSLCKRIVLVWLMDDQWVVEKLTGGIEALGLDLKSVTLLCEKEELITRWNGDTVCEWRTEEWLRSSLRSLPYFAGQKNVVNTTGLTVDQVADLLLQ